MLKEYQNLRNDLISHVKVPVAESCLVASEVSGSMIYEAVEQDMVDASELSPWDFMVRG